MVTGEPQEIGTLVSFGNASGKSDPLDPLDVLELGLHGSLFLTRPRLHDYTGTRHELVASAQAVFTGVREGWLKPHIGAVFPLSLGVLADNPVAYGSTSCTC